MSEMFEKSTDSTRMIGNLDSGPKIVVAFFEGTFHIEIHDGRTTRIDLSRREALALGELLTIMASRFG